MVIKKFCISKLYIKGVASNLMLILAKISIFVRKNYEIVPS